MIKEIILIVTALFIINVIIDNKRETKKKKNYNKKILAIIIITILSSLFVISIIYDSIKEENKKQEIIKYVYDNKDLLLKYISDNNYDDPEELNKFKVKIYPNEKRGYIEFLYFNDTMLTSFKYYGFYYSFDGKYKELDLPEAKNKLKKNGKGYYYQNGDDSLYTEKIIDNFYYYKMMY